MTVKRIKLFEKYALIVALAAVPCSCSRKAERGDVSGASGVAGVKIPLDGVLAEVRRNYVSVVSICSLMSFFSFSELVKSQESVSAKKKYWKVGARDQNLEGCEVVQDMFFSMDSDATFEMIGGRAEFFKHIYQLSGRDFDRALTVFEEVCSIGVWGSNTKRDLSFLLLAEKQHQDAWKGAGDVEFDREELGRLAKPPEILRKKRNVKAVFYFLENGCYGVVGVRCEVVLDESTSGDDGQSRMEVVYHAVGRYF